MSALLRKLQQLLAPGGTSVLTGVAGVFGLKAAITLVNFALVTLAARAFGTDAFGTYSLLFSAAGLLGIVATFGQQVLVMRFWSEYVARERGDLLKGSLLFSATLCLIGCVLFGIPFLLWCAASHGTELAMTATAYLVSLSIVMTTAHLIRNAVGVATGDGWANLLLALPGAAYLGACLAIGLPPELSIAFAVMAAGAFLAVLIHLRALHGALRAAFPEIARVRPAFRLSVWSHRSIRLWASNGLEAANQYLDVLIVGILMDPATAGAYFVLTRVANVISVASDAIHMFCTRHIPELYFRRQLPQLNAILDTAAWMTLTVIVGSVLAIVVGGHWLLAIFSNAYAGYHAVLIVLSIGAASLAAAGPSSSILMLTGHEGKYLTIISATVLLRLASFAVLIPLLGIAGAATAATLSFLLVSVLLRHAVRARTGIDGSILRLLARGGSIPVQAPQAQG